MKVVEARNVNEAYKKGLKYLLKEGRHEQTRNGWAIVAPSPVITVYANPAERVLFDRVRKANPFFHLFESLWMLAGSNDGRFLDRFVGDFSARYGEADGRIHGAYGHRWRRHFGVDQLGNIIERFRNEPDTRQCVLEMWDAKEDLTSSVRDRPCNTHIYFRINSGLLDMTVCNRSNDAIWGAYGANAVHMSVLHEWMAATLNVGMGKYYQVSNNFHAYTDTLAKYPVFDQRIDPYRTAHARPWPMPGGWAFLEDCEQWVTFAGAAGPDAPWRTTYFAQVVLPLERGHCAFKAKDYQTALAEVERCVAEDWRLAATQFIERVRDAGK